MTFRRILFATTPAICGVGLCAASAYATPPEGDSVRTDLAKGNTSAPVSIVTNGVPHRVVNGPSADAEVIVTYTVPADVAVRGDSPDVCAK